MPSESSVEGATPRPAESPNGNMPEGSLADRLLFTASALCDAVSGDETADQAAEWFNLGFMATAAKQIREAVAELASTRAALREAQTPDTWWLWDDTEVSITDLDDELRDIVEVGDTARLLAGHTLPNQWAAHIRIPATPDRDEDSEIQLFATEAEARAALDSAAGEGAVRQ